MSENNQACQYAPAEDRFQVRHRFVGLMFALAMTEVARQGVHLFEHDSRWSSAAVFHLVLCIVLIAASWVGWSNSIGERKPLLGIFELQFIDLLLDILLVFTYFVIVSRVELSTGEDAHLPLPSAVPESKGLIVVFAVYAIWDFFTDVLPNFRASAPFVYASVSVFCLALTWLCLLACGKATGDAGVIAIDISLMALVIAFRALKSVEGTIARRMGWGQDAEKLRLPSVRDYIVLSVCGVLYFGGLVAGYLLK